MPFVSPAKASFLIDDTSCWSTPLRCYTKPVCQGFTRHPRKGPTDYFAVLFATVEAWSVPFKRGRFIVDFCVVVFWPRFWTSPPVSLDLVDGFATFTTPTFASRSSFLLEESELQNLLVAISRIRISILANIACWFLFWCRAVTSTKTHTKY